MPRIVLLLALLCFVLPGWARDVLHVYGPGGPAPAMKEAAQAYGKAHGIEVIVVAGPTPQWADQARQDADVIFSGAENMMTSFVATLPGLFALDEAQPLYLRPAAILVRPGNPKRIRGLRDLLKPGVRVLTVAGAGQTGLWEDVAGRRGDIRTVRALRANIAFPEAGNSAEARQRWQDDATLDAWLTWNIWQTTNPTLADVVALEPDYRIYRDIAVVVTRHGKHTPHAAGFITFLGSAEGARIFRKAGWITP
jgi:accessory colonization factor AcfC